MKNRFTDEEPFGKPDGSSDDIDQSRGAIVNFPPRFGGISRSPADAKVRVVVGQLGSGKSLQLRRMQDYMANERNGAQVAIKVEASSELTTQSIQKFAELLKLRGGNTEDWKLLWRRAIIRSAITHLLFSDRFKDGLSADTRSRLLSKVQFIGDPETPHKVTQEVQTIIQHFHKADSLRNYIADPRWADVEHYVSQALNESAGLLLYVDDVDKNFRWAPALWIQCQRGLFYAVMDLLRNDDLRSKLHVVMALRDVAFSSIRTSEHAARYLDRTHISVLFWTRSAMAYLLQAKLVSIPSEYFSNPLERTLDSWLGRKTIRNSRPNAAEESLEDYMLRHTNLVPRDLVRMGNLLCAEIRALDGGKPSEFRIREIISDSAADAAKRQVAQCANQYLSDIIPPDAFAKDYDHVFLNPNLYALGDAMDHIIACISLSEREVFGRDGLEAMDKEANERFSGNGNVQLSNILWQQGLLGYVDDAGVGRYYRVDSVDGVSLRLPRRDQITEYVWNPIVFDLSVRLLTTLETPHWPK